MKKIMLAIAMAMFSAVFPAQAADVSKGKLTAANGKSFPYTYSNVGQNSVTAVYVGGMGGRGNEVSKIAAEFAKSGINLVTFDRAEASCRSTKACVAKVAARVPSKKLVASPDGRPTAADDIMKNELSSILDFAISSPGYNRKKGIVLIGGSYGSWLAMVATTSKYKSHIKGVVFLSPALNPAWFSGQKAPNEGVAAYKKVSRSFGSRKAIAIGSKKDIAVPNVSTFTAASFLHKTLKSRPQVVEVKSSKHSSKLILGDKNVRGLLINWISANF